MAPRTTEAAARAGASAVHVLLDRIFGIPRIDPRAAAAFRMAVGCGLVWLIWTDANVGYPDGTRVLRPPGTGYGAGTWEIAHWLRAHPDPTGPSTSPRSDRHSA